MVPEAIATVVASGVDYSRDSKHIAVWNADSRGVDVTVVESEAGIVHIVQHVCEAWSLGEELEVFTRVAQQTGHRYVNFVVIVGSFVMSAPMRDVLKKELSNASLREFPPERELA